MRSKLLKFGLFSLLLVFAAACSSGTQSTATFSNQGTPAASGSKTIYFVIGSENEAVMKTIVQPRFSGQGWTANYQKLGSVDQKIMLQFGTMADSNGVSFNVM